MATRQRKTTPAKSRPGSWPKEATVADAYDKMNDEAKAEVKTTPMKRTRKTKAAAPKRARKTKPAAKGDTAKQAAAKAVKYADKVAAKKQKALARQAAAQVKREEREAKAAAKEKVIVKAEKSLATVAKTVNVRFEKAAQADGKADDHRLAAAIHLASAKETCTEAGINFKKWAEANVTQGYETVRKMLAIGSASDPAQAMADLRAGNKAANQKARDKAKAAVSDDSEGDAGNAGASEQEADVPGQMDALTVTKQHFSVMSKDDQAAFIDWAIDETGY